MKKIIKISGSSIELLKRKPLATLETIFGVGRIKAKKLLSILLTNPGAKKFKVNLVDAAQDLKVQNSFKAVLSDNNLRLKIYENLERKAKIGCYKGRRILQNLPARGQQTHNNAGTISRLNPMLSLGIKTNLTQELILNNKRWELGWNARSTDLLEINNKVPTRKYSKSASLAKQKKKNQKKQQAKTKTVKKKKN